MRKAKTTSTPTAVTPLSKTKAKRIARKLERAIKLGAKIGELAERRSQLYRAAVAAGLPVDGVIRLSDGFLYTVQKPTGKFVRFNELEIKKVPAFKRTPIDDAAPATEGGAE